MKVVDDKINKRNVENNSYDEENYEGSLPVYCKVKQSKEYRVFLDEVVTSPSYYRNVINILEDAESNDVVVFRLNTPGGNILSMLGIINAIKNTEATTIALAEGYVASAGTFIMLACDNVQVMYNTLIMCHPASYGAYGSQQNVKVYVEATDKWLRKMTFEYYKHFMTDEEIEDMIVSSKEVYMDEEELVRRLKIRQEKLNEEYEGNDAEDQPAQNTPKPRASSKPRKSASKTAKKVSNRS